MNIPKSDPPVDHVEAETVTQETAASVKHLQEVQHQRGAEGSNQMLATEEEIERNYRWNVTVNVLDSAFHGLSIGLVSPITILPLYVSHFTNKPLLVGLVAAIAGSAYLFPQLFVANFVERLDRKKPVVVYAGFFLERLPFLGMALSSLLLTRSYPAWALFVFFLMFAWHGLGEGVVVVAWRDMLAKLFSANQRGRFFGVAYFFDALMGVLGASMATYILGKLEFPGSFTLLFTFAFVGLCVAWIFLSLNREPAKPPNKLHVSQSVYFSQLPAIINADPNFRNFLLSRIVFGIGRMGIGFVAVYAVARWTLSDSVVGQFTALLLIAQMISYLALGFLADRYGHKLSIVIGLGAIVLAMFLLIRAPTHAWLYLVFGLTGTSLATEVLSSQVIVFEFAPEEDRPTYIGLASTMSGVFGIISPLIGGWIAGIWGYEALFGLSSMLLILAFILLVATVREPRCAKGPRKLETGNSA